MICPDTNVLIRAFVQPANTDDERQAHLARRVLSGSEPIVIHLVALCEMAWVLRSVYRLSSLVIAELLERLVSTGNTVCDRASVDLGLLMLRAGGDFADGAIAAAGAQAGAGRFVSFDRRAVSRLVTLGHDAVVPTE